MSEPPEEIIAAAKFLGLRPKQIPTLDDEIIDGVWGAVTRMHPPSETQLRANRARDELKAYVARRGTQGQKADAAPAVTTNTDVAAAGSINNQDDVQQEGLVAVGNYFFKFFGIIEFKSC